LKFSKSTARDRQPENLSFPLKMSSDYPKHGNKRGNDFEDAVFKKHYSEWLGSYSLVFSPWGGPLNYGAIIRKSHLDPLADARNFIAGNLEPGIGLNDFMQSEDVHVSRNPCRVLSFCNCIAFQLENKRAHVQQITNYLRGLIIPGKATWTEREHGKFGENSVFVAFHLAVLRLLPDEEQRIWPLQWRQMLHGIHFYDLLEFSSTSN